MFANLFRNFAFKLQDNEESNRQHDLIIELNKAYMTLKNKGVSLQQVVETAIHMTWNFGFHFTASDHKMTGK